jgi:predicted amidohydrolase
MATGDGGARRDAVRITLAQIDCRLGDVPENCRRVREALDQARAQSSDLVVFPELTLTGYSVGRVGDDLSRAVTDAEIADLARHTDEPACVVGLAEAGHVHTYNSAVYLERGAVRHVHRKLFLPTYDIWEERKHFTPGGAMRAFETRFGRMAILVCGDAWQPVLAVLAVQDGARVLIVPANSTERRAGIEEEWRDITRFYARMLECYVVFVNRVGDEPGLRFWGGSHIYDPWGELVVEAPLHEPALVSADIDLGAVRRRRREMPLVKEARLALLSRELDRLAAEGGDL